MSELRDFYKNKKVLITGITGFKGSWLTCSLLDLGADVIGYSLHPDIQTSMFNILSLNGQVKTYFEDIRNYNALKSCFEVESPELVFHLAAQPLVRDSYTNPRYTYECNVMGTVNILECIRETMCVYSFLNITTDKVYQNNEWEWGYRENERLDGFDPYSNSKSCSELITTTYIRSFPDLFTAISTARAGNVIGGGDFSKDRIIPDCVRAAGNSEKIVVRNPNSIRPYQHVMEAINAYLLIAQKQYEYKEYAGNYNVGPEETDCLSTGKIADLFCKYWGNNQEWIYEDVNGPHEANFLKLDCSHIKNKLGWKQKWSVELAVEKSIEWYKNYKSTFIKDITMSQIREFI